ncbi:sulfotransferase domain-containing protein [Methylobacterium sp. 22177]|uniref:sulfotransferase domain-containing protein n=1 Tax=Methylobacterium sp. 22177 TaxID=3453885 RepID=UPI003F839E26
MSPPSKPRRVVFLGFRRGGSSIVFQSIQHILNNSGHRVHDLVAEKYAEGDGSAPTAADLEKALAENDVVGCFREPPPADADLSAFAVKYILLVRDPRDCDYSWWYARNLHKHDFKKYDSLDEYLRGEKFDQFDNLVDYAENKSAAIYKYEDAFFDPTGFLHSMIAEIGIRFDVEAFDVANIFMAMSNPIGNIKIHNRSGLPFQAVTVLPESSIAILNEKYGSLLKRLGYSMERDKSLDAAVAARFEIDSLRRIIKVLMDQNHARAEEIGEIFRAASVADQKIRGAMDTFKHLSEQISALSETVTALSTENHIRIGHLQKIDEEVLQIKQSIEDFEALASIPPEQKPH